MVFRIEELANKNKSAANTTKYGKKAYSQLQQYYRRIEREGREEILKAISSGADPCYIIKTSKELGKYEPIFLWNKGKLTFTKNQI